MASVRIDCIENMQYNKIDSIVNKLSLALASGAISLLSFPRLFIYAYKVHYRVKIATKCIYKTTNSCQAPCDAHCMEGKPPAYGEMVETYRATIDNMPQNWLSMPIRWIMEETLVDLEDLHEYLLVNTDTELHDLMNNFVQKLSRDV